MLLIVTYQRKTARDYTSFFDALEKQGSHWWHFQIFSLLRTTKTPQEVSEAIRPHQDPVDFLFITEIGRWNGWLPKEALSWIQTQLAQPDSAAPSRADALFPSFPTARPAQTFVPQLAAGALTDMRAQLSMLEAQSQMAAEAQATFARINEQWERLNQWVHQSNMEMANREIAMFAGYPLPWKFLG
jgi:hypothetical protein